MKRTSHDKGARIEYHTAIARAFPFCMESKERYFSKLKIRIPVQTKKRVTRCRKVTVQFTFENPILIAGILK